MSDGLLLDDPMKINKDKSPIIYCHFGNSFYLEFILAVAIKSCPNRSVVVLGDRSNAWLKRTGAKHELLDDYLKKSRDYELFNTVFRLSGGTIFLDSINKSKTIVSGVSTCWTKFNFLKWIGLYEYLMAHQIDQCWFFDSDMLILADPSDTEYRLLANQVKWTYWNDLHQHQGWIGDVDILDNFIKNYIGLFRDGSVIERLENSEFLDNPSWGFTLMRAWDDFYQNVQKSHSGLLQESFQDNILVCLDAHDQRDSHKFYMSRHAWNGRSAKEIFYDKDGRLYARLAESDGFIPIACLSMSWVDPSLFRALRRVLRNKNMRHLGIRSLDEFKSHQVVELATNLLKRIRNRLFGHVRKGF